MARLEQDFTGNLEELDFTPKRKVLAPGKYKAIITKADVSLTKDRNGTKLTIDFQIVEGEYKGEVLTENLNIKNQNEIAQRIGISKKARLATIVCGTPNPQDTDMLLNKLVIIQTDTEANDYIARDGVEVKGTQNVIKNYHPLTGEFKDLVTGKKSATSTVSSVNNDSDIPF